MDEVRSAHSIGVWPAAPAVRAHLVLRLRDGPHLESDLNRFQKWALRTFFGLQERPTSQDYSRMYSNAVPSRFNQGFPSFNTSEDLELVSSLRNLRARSRSLARDAGYAKSARRVIVNNVIGQGVRIQPAVKTARGGFNERVNSGIGEAWARWMRAPNCHTGGSMHFHDLERQCMGQVFDAGEIFIRIHRLKFGWSQVPIALEVVEPERIVDGYAYPGSVSPKSGGVRLGIESDKFKKPIAYWIRDLHPGDIRLNLEQSDAVTRVDAADVIHIYAIDRWPQTRGVPWLHAAAEKLQDVNGYSEAEIIAARGAASYLGTIETPESGATFAQRAPDNTLQVGVEPGIWLKLQPGEKATFVSPNRPTTALDPFMKYMLREIAAAVGVSYESLSHDYSSGSYSSMRVSMLAERDIWRALQAWWIRSFRERLHREWLTAAVMARNVVPIDLLDFGENPEKFLAANFRPRGWSWIDPTKEVTAYVQAVKSGFRTVGNVIEETGGGADLEDVMKTRQAELEYFKELQLPFDTSPDVYVPAESRGQVLVGKDGLPAPAAAVSAQALKDAGLSPAPMPGQPGATQPAVVDKAQPGGAAGDDSEEPGSAEGPDEDRVLQLSSYRRSY
jgi:lambda family phage portal protein